MGVGEGTAVSVGKGVSVGVGEGSTTVVGVAEAVGAALEVTRGMEVGVVVDESPAHATATVASTARRNNKDEFT